MAKFKAPAGMTAVSVGGQELQVVDGIIETPDDVDYATALAPFGVTALPVDAPAAQTEAKPAKAKKSKPDDSDVIATVVVEEPDAPAAQTEAAAG